MSSFLHALVGHSESVEQKSNDSTVHQVVHDDVQVQSKISSQIHTKVTEGATQEKINALMAKLASTHLQVDDYSRRRVDEISEAVKNSLEKIVHLSQVEQERLLDEVEKQSHRIEMDYQNKLMAFIDQLDDERAVKLAALEKDLNACQEKILESARQRIDGINEEANRLKINVLKEAQAKTQWKVDEITDRVVQLGTEDTSYRLKSTITTVITTKAESEAHSNKMN